MRETRVGRRAGRCVGLVVALGLLLGAAPVAAAPCERPLPKGVVAKRMADLDIDEIIRTVIPSFDIAKQVAHTEDGRVLDCRGAPHVATWGDEDQPAPPGRVQVPYDFGLADGRRVVFLATAQVDREYPLTLVGVVAVLRLVPGATPLVRAEALAEFDERLENVAVRKLLGRELIVAHIPTKGTGGGEQEGDTQIWEAQGAAFVSILRFTSDGEDSIGAYLKKGTRIGKDGCLWQGIFSSELAEAAGALEVRVTTNWEWGPPNGLGPPCRVKRPPQSRRYVDRYVFKGDKLVAKGPLHRGHPLKDDRPR